MAIVALVCALCWAGCSSADSSQDEDLATRDQIRLPRGAYPRFITFAEDGSMWVSEAHGGALARIEEDGDISQYRLPERESSPGTVAEGPDGAIWTLCLFGLCRVPPEDPIEVVADFPASNVLALQGEFVVDPDGSLWIGVNSSEPLRIAHTSPTELLEVTKVPTRGFEVSFTGMARGPDGALWFTHSGEERGESPDAIGRFGPDGRLRRWHLPNPRSGPAQIVAGPDGALWFVERNTYRIGRISTDGEISEFQLRPGLAPADIAVGSDRALWFTTEKKVGRITLDGRAKAWPVAGAEQLEGIAVSDDGEVWVADPPADTIRHFEPPR